MKGNETGGKFPEVERDVFWPPVDWDWELAGPPVDWETEVAGPPAACIQDHTQKKSDKNQTYKGRSHPPKRDTQRAGCRLDWLKVQGPLEDFWFMGHSAYGYPEFSLFKEKAD